jgi:co-chaperonin GroES (HSP10)
MSEIIMPGGNDGLVLPPDVAAELEAEKAEMVDKARQLPDPVGWKILCAVPQAEDTFEGSSIVMSDAMRKQEEIATTVLFVAKLGPDCYTDKTKYPNGPWCQEGDFVLVRTYSGTRFKIHGREFRVIYEDQVEATVQDPRGILRAAA